MLFTEDLPSTVNKLTGFQCDKCKVEYRESSEGYGEGDIEITEKYSLVHSGGFGSVFGDGAKVKCDLCQRCLRELIGNFAEIEYVSPY